MGIRITSAQAKEWGIKIPPRANKYGAVKTQYAGVTYDSKAEAKRAGELDLMVRAGEIKFWIAHPVFRLGVPENKYVADFLVVGFGTVHVEDTKGRETAKFRRDRKLWARYGPCDLRVLTKHGTEVIYGGAHAH